MRSAENEFDRRRKAAARQAVRDLAIPEVRNLRRRRMCERDPQRWLRTYLPRMFGNPFTADLRDMLQTILDCARYGGTQAIAGPRGSGKTTIIKGAVIYALLTRLMRFPIIVGKNALEGVNRLNEIKTAFETSEELADDYPEVCVPIRALEGWASRGRLQTVNGRRTMIVWAGTHIILPTVEGSPASGAIVMAIGREGAIRGQNIRNTRPDIAIVDDIEDRESANSETETATIRKIITEDIAGLAGPGRSMAIVYPCTIVKRGCVADQLTDRVKSPPWNGRRYKLLVKPPTHGELWGEYMELRQKGQFEGDMTARAANSLYLARRAEMDDGAEVSNPYTFDPQELPDGSHLENSALQHVYNHIADFGAAAFETEYQNNPPAEEAPTTTGITVHGVMAAVNGSPRGIVPARTQYLTAAIDVHARSLYWTLTAWVDARGLIVDYGREVVSSPIGHPNDAENTAAVDAAILAALLEWRDRASNGWPEADGGEVRNLDCVLIDARWRPDPVKAFCKDITSGVYRPCMGFGSGMKQARYHAPAKRGHGRRLGVHWYATRDPVARLWIHNLNADFFKLAVHTGFQMPQSLPGSLCLFGSDPVKHRDFADQINAEQWTEEFKPGKGKTAYWDVRNHRNHWLDTTANTIAAAEILGVRTVTAETAAAMATTAAEEQQTGDDGQPPAKVARAHRVTVQRKRSLAAIQRARRGR